VNGVAFGRVVNGEEH